MNVAKMQSLGIYTLHLLIRKIKDLPTRNEIKMPISAHQNNLAKKPFYFPDFFLVVTIFQDVSTRLGLKCPLACLVRMENQQMLLPLFSFRHRVTTAHRFLHSYTDRQLLKEPSEHISRLCFAESGFTTAVVTLESTSS